MLRHLPNALTFLRLLLAVPLGLLILRQQYDAALAVAFLAGITDALDGYFARRLQAFSEFGAALDPIADKILVTIAFLCFATVGLIPWYLAIVVVSRDIIIVCGALTYRSLIGPFEMAATTLSKVNMTIQICFCVLLLTGQVVPGIPAQALGLWSLLVIVIAVVSGLDYIITWARRAVEQRDQDKT